MLSRTALGLNAGSKWYLLAFAIPEAQEFALH